MPANQLDSTTYFTLAVTAARAHACGLHVDAERAPHVVVTGRIGESSHPRSFADVSDDGAVLVVISSDDHSHQSLYRPGTWREAAVYDAEGHVLSHYVAPTPVHPLRKVA